LAARRVNRRRAAARGRSRRHRFGSVAGWTPPILMRRTANLTAAFANRAANQNIHLNLLGKIFSADHLIFIAFRKKQYILPSTG
jgi:hypothetical protein